MSRFVWGVALAAWGGAAFWGVLWLTFPSDAVAARLGHELRTRTEGRYDVEIDAVSPWWFGLAADRVVVTRPDPAAETDPSAPRLPVFLADRVAASVGPLQLLRRTVALSGYLRLGGADLGYDLRARAEGGRLQPSRVRLDGAGLPVAELLALGGFGETLALSGKVDVDVDLDLAQGTDKAEGTIALVGDGVTLVTVTAATLGWQDKELGVELDELDLAFAVAEGKAEVTSGVVGSRLFDAEVTGEIDLAAELMRSRVNLGLVVGFGDWSGSPLESYRTTVESFLTSAKWDDGKYHYAVDATLSRLSFSDLRPERERGKAAARPRTALPAGATESPPPPTPVTPPPAAAAPPTPPQAVEKPPVPDDADVDEPEALDEVEGDEPAVDDEGL